MVGHFSSGGHGPLSSSYGLAVDNVLEIRIVTPDGELCTVNPCLNPDLFWALRGGGGGTFGVVTSVTMKAYPAPQATSHSFTLAGLDADNQTAFWDTVALGPFRVSKTEGRRYAGLFYYLASRNYSSGAELGVELGILSL